MTAPGPETVPGQAMSLLVLGVSHATAPVEQREKASLEPAGARALLGELLATGAVSEAVALSTCNRTEVYCACPDPLTAERAVAAAVVAHTRISAGELACARYVLRDDLCAAQLFRVAASLDSMIVGEGEIQGQVREAWELATREGATGPVLNQLFRHAAEVGKEVRSRTRIGAGSSSIPAAALDLAERALVDLPSRRVLLIGAGRMADATALALLKRGVRDVVIANRTAASADDLAGRFGGRGVGLDRLDAELRAADIVISSTGAPAPILGRVRMEAAMAARADRPMVIVDISVPRDVDPTVTGVGGVELFDIDDLESIVEAGLDGRRREALRAEALVGAAVQRFSSWRRGLSAAPAIASLRARAETIRRGELGRLESQWDGLSEADRERLEILTRGIVNKLLHEPSVRMRAAAELGDREAQAHLTSMRYLFGLEDGRRVEAAR